MMTLESLQVIFYLLGYPKYMSGCLNNLMSDGFVIGLEVCKLDYSILPYGTPTVFLLRAMRSNYWQLAGLNYKQVQINMPFEIAKST